MDTKGKIIAIGVIIILASLGIYELNINNSAQQNDNSSVLDPRNATYEIEGAEVTLVNGVSEIPAAPGSASKVTTKYFGNEAEGDFNGDGVEDVAFLLTREDGGSGTFYYLAALVSNAGKFIGTNAVLIGDRIAPQTTEFRNGMIIINYADRKSGEPFSAQPSVGVSRYFKVIDGVLMEVTPKISESEAQMIAEKSCIKGGEALGSGSYNENTKTWWFDANLNATKPGCNPACVVSEETKTAEINWRCTGLKASN